MDRSGGCLGVAARALALALAAVLALTLPISLVAHDLGRVILSPGLMTELIVSRAVESGMLRKLVTDQIFAQARAGGGEQEGLDFAQATAYLEPAEIDSLTDIFFPPGWAREQIVSLITELYAWPDNDKLLPDLTLDLRPIGQSLRSGGASRLVETVVDSWPSCSVEQVDQMAAAATTGQVPILYCEPPEPFRTILKDYAVTAILEQVSGMPPAIRLTGERGASASPSQIMALKERIRLARTLVTWGWILPLSLLGLIMALVIRSYRSLTRWWGIPLLIGGVLALGGLLLGSVLAQQFLATLAQGDIPEIANRLVREIADGLLKAVQRRLLWHSLLLVVASAALLVSGFFFRKRAPAPIPPGSSGGAAAGTFR